MIATLLQLQWMSLRGRVIRSVRLLRQPKYLVGAVFGVGWMLFWVGRPMLQSGMRFKAIDIVGIEGLATELMPTIHLLASLGFTLILSVSWLSPFGKLGLGFREAELTLLLQAPLTRRRIIHYGLLKSAVGVAITAFFFALILGSGGPLERLQTFFAIGMLFYFWDLNGKWRGLFLLRQREIGASAALVRRAALTVGLLSFWLALAWVVFRFQQSVIAGFGGLEAQAILRRIASVPAPALLEALSLPGRVLTAPIFAQGWTAFAAAALPVLLLIVAQRELVLRSPARFEESALEHAKARETKKSKSRRRGKISSRTRRYRVFDLDGRGAPAAAVFWKNLMSVSRIPLRRVVPAAVAFLVLLIVIPPLAGLHPAVHYIMTIAGMAAMVIPSAMTGMMWHNDLRVEFGHLEMIRTWPVRPERLVPAEVLSPAVSSLFVLLFGAGLVLAGFFGSRLRAVWTGEPSSVVIFPVDGIAGLPSGFVLVLALLGVFPVLAGCAFVSSALQNLAILFVPAWMAEMGDAHKGIAAFGQRLLFSMGIFLAFALALIPSAILVGLAVLAQGLLGIPWSALDLPLWGLLGAVPLFVMGRLIVWVAAGLWRDLDPSQEVLEVGS